MDYNAGFDRGLAEDFQQQAGANGLSSSSPQPKSVQVEVHRAGTTVQTIFILLILFGAWSISDLWVDVLRNSGESIGWSRGTLSGSLYLAATFTIFFLIVVVALDYIDINFQTALVEIGL